MNNILIINNRFEFRDWLILNHEKENECYIKNLKRGNHKDFCYLDAVEEALCFGWIDSTYKNVDGELYQRFSKRSKKSNWTILNIERVKRLNRLGLMTKAGLDVVPKDEYVFDEVIISDIKKAGLYDTFKSFPILYQKIRCQNLKNTYDRSKEQYIKSFENFKKYTSKNKMYGLWNDYGRLK